MKKMLQEFKEFISRGNVLDLAVGVIVGGAFSSIVTSLVNNILTPIIGLLLGGVNFAGLSINFRNTTIYYGAFIQSIIDFLIVAACIFVIVKLVNKLSKLGHKKEEKKEAEAPKDENTVLLEEIRDLLKKQNSSKKAK